MRNTERFEGYSIRTMSYFEGIQIYYEAENGTALSIICHKGSYGSSHGLFETRCSWLGDVQGWLSFGQVQQKINTFKKKALKRQNQTCLGGKEDE